MRRNLLVAGFVGFLCFGHTHPAGSVERTYGDVTIARVVSVYDGDTFRVDVDGWPAIIGERIRVRVAGIDCAEMNAADPEAVQRARRAKQFTVAMLRAARVVELRDMRRGQYFRIVADVYCDGESLGDALLAAGLADVYPTRP